MKLFFDIIDKRLFAENSRNAVAKPRWDALELARRDEYETWVEVNRFYTMGRPVGLVAKVRRKLHLLQMAVLRCRLKSMRGAEVKMQYPFLVPEMLGFAEQLKEQGCRLTLLVHDWYQIREHREHDYTEERLLQIVDKMIVHSQAMEDFVRAKGFKGEAEQLHFFPFLTEYESKADDRKEDSATNSKMRIIFAGNLEKSGFVKELPEVAKALGSDVEFLLYGKPEPDHLGAGVRYMGCFSNDDISVIEGNWGLVWDGPSAKTCEGETGEYLRYNAPYKASLYKALGVPLIVWSGSAQADYVREHRLGIVVDSLYDIAKYIHQDR